VRLFRLKGPALQAAQGDEGTGRLQGRKGRRIKVVEGEQRPRPASEYATPGWESWRIFHRFTGGRDVPAFSPHLASFPGH
jgi:hypothetical protein